MGQASAWLQQQIYSPSALPIERPSDWITFRSAGETSTATTTALIPATANVTSGQIPTRGETSRETPFASTSDSPTLRRVTNVDAMPARLRSMNSTRLKWVPDRDDQLGAALVGEQERDVLADPRRRHRRVREPERRQPLRPGRSPVRVGVHEQLRARLQRGIGDRVEVADDDVRLEADLEQRVGATVDRDEDRLEVPDVRAARS